MIETLLLVAGLATVGAGASTAGWLAGKRRGATDAEIEGERRLAAVATQRDAAKKRAREALGESTRWKALTLAADTLGGEPVYADRASPRDTEELARLLRGLMLIDDVVLSDASGLPLTREDTRASADLAAVAPHVMASVRRLDLAALGVAQMSFETFSADHVCARPLVGRAAGAMLLVRTTSQPANPLAVDAVVHASALSAKDPPEVSRSLATAGSNERIAVDDPRFTQAFGLLERELGREFSAAVLATDGDPLLSIAQNGPSAEARRAVSLELDGLQDRVTRALHTSGIARIEVKLHGGDVVTWSSLGPSSRVAIVTFGQVGRLSGPRLDRLLGAVRRGISGHENAESTRGTR